MSAPPRCSRWVYLYCMNSRSRDEVGCAFRGWSGALSGDRGVWSLSGLTVVIIRTGRNDDDERHINGHTAVSGYRVRTLHSTSTSGAGENHLGSRALKMPCMQSTQTVPFCPAETPVSPARSRHPLYVCSHSTPFIAGRLRPTRRETKIDPRVLLT